jgi:Predicted membrane protein (DUF2207)
MRFFAFILASLLWLAPAAAEEVIRNFVSDATVNTDGSLDVRETITVNAEGREIKRGIRRDFPTTYTDRNGVRVHVGFDVAAVTRDGADETYSTESMSNGVRIKIGNANVFLDRGEHTYVIRYRTTKQLGFFQDYDELYWNVTGNGWTFPIERASTTITLPQGANIGGHAIYTGAQGSKGKDAQVSSAQGNRFETQTTRRLSPGESFTVAVNWQKGIVTPSSESEKQRDRISDNFGYFILALTSVLVPLYYLWAWWRVGRDPPKGTIVPLFSPPEGMGPAGVRYVYKAGYDDKAFAAGVVGLAVKGHMKIFKEDGDYRLRKTDAGGQPLTRSEASLLKATPSGTLALERANHTSVIGMRSALEATLDDEYDGVMYLKNLKWFVLGLAVTVLCFVLAMLLMPPVENSDIIALGLFSLVWWGVILFIGASIVRGLFQGYGVFTKIKSLMGLIFLVPFVGGGLLMSGVSSIVPGVRWYYLAAAALALCNLIFYWLLKAPTPRGRSVLDHIEGFRMYMTTAEEERLKVLHPPEKTPELFERFLPYAMALDCENQWNDKFAAVLAAAAAAGATAGASGGWYSGPGSFTSNDFGSSLGSSLTSSISSSGVAPGSSSGSFGGGSSGGGGGGGGGSGW